jgi:Uma2 family endonuclease
VIVVEDEAMDTMGAIDATAIALAVEVVSPSNPENDYVHKVRDYPLMAVPHYLIVDPRDGTCVHHWGIEAGRYADVVHYRFGDKVPLGDRVVDTAELSPYPSAG